MSLIIDHLEYLLRRHDCVTVPGIGALMVRYRPARFDNRNSLVIHPPSRELVFNGALVESDGVLENSIARRDGVSFEAARRIVNEEAESLSHQLRTFGSLMLGRLGELIYTEYGTILFNPHDVAGWDFRYYGLMPLYLKNAENAVSSGREPEMIPVAGKVASGVPAAGVLPPVRTWNPDGYGDDVVVPGHDRRNRLTRSIVGIAASLAVIVTLALFFLNPIKVDNEPMKASLAPTETAVSRQEKVCQVEEKVESDVAAEQESEMSSENYEASAEPAGNLGDTRVEVAADEAVESPKAKTVTSKADIVSKRFLASDPYCVIVASFPVEEQAERYIAENRGKKLGVLQQDGKYRVYAATGSTYEEAAAQKAQAGVAGAWICRR